MARKIDPRIFRISINKDWDSHWFAPKGKFGPYLAVDQNIRTIVFALFTKGIIDKVLIERSLNALKVTILTPRPGLVVGKQGAQIREIEKRIAALVNKGVKPLKVTVEIQEIKDPELHAHIIAQEMAAQLERRMSHKRILKQTLGRLARHKGIKGAKLKVKGRLDGADIARSEWVFTGSVPLHTLRSDIDYGFAEAITKWGVVGVKVWIYKGEVFKQFSSEDQRADFNS